MVTNIQRKIKTIGSSLYHCGLVKKLIEAHFNSKGDNWEDFLVWNHYKEVEQDESSSNIRRSRWKLPSNPKLQNEIPAQEIPQDEHTYKYSDDKNPL